MFFNTALADTNSYQYAAQAQILNDLGLYNGISTTSFEPDLGSALNREAGIVMLLRLFGLEAEVANMSDADEILSRFSDAGKISDWAKKSIAYAIQIGLVKGLPDGSIGPRLPMNGKSYSTLLLRQLGYNPDYDEAPAQLADKGGITAAQASLYANKDLIRDDMVGISYGCLRVNDTTGRSVLENLVDQGAVERERAEAAILNAPDLRAALPTPTPTATPTPTPTPTPIPTPTPTPTLSPTPTPRPTAPPSYNEPPSSSDDSANREKPQASVIQSQDNRIVVRFNEPVVSTTSQRGAKNPSNFKLFRIDGGFVENAASVAEKIPGVQYEVSFNTLTKGNCGEYILSITGISDLSGNSMADFQQNLAVIPFSIVDIE